MKTKLAALISRVAGFKSRPLPLYWYRVDRNLGDVLSAVIVSEVSGGTPVWVSPKYRGKLLAVGSVLQSLADGDHVWGAGAISDAPLVPVGNVVFHAVRGPLTAKLIRADLPVVYGDPAMLLPRFYRPAPRPRYSLGVIPHFMEQSLIVVEDPGVLRIDVLGEWRCVVDQIASCDLVLSSSLHGMILAEAYGVPAIWITASDKVVGGGFKFRDYYLSTDRDPPDAIPWSKGMTALSSRALPLPQVDLDPLLRSFPASFRLPSYPSWLRNEIRENPIRARRSRR